MEINASLTREGERPTCPKARDISEILPARSNVIHSANNKNFDNRNWVVNYTVL